MAPMDLPEFLKLLVLMLAGAKLLGFLAQKLGQPAVLGELAAGVLLGRSLIGVVDPSHEVLRLLSELGVILLLFSIGLETDLKTLLKVGPASLAVAVAGVVLPFALGYATARLLGQSNLVSIVCGAALTATSVGITARVLSDLDQLKAPESQVILGAAIFDDVIGLVILTVVAGLTGGRGVTLAGVAQISAVAVGFLIGTIAIGTWVVPILARLVAKVELPGTPTLGALILAFGLAWLADRLGSAVIIGAFAAGLLIVDVPNRHDIEVGVTRLGHFFVPLFFVVVGASVDIGSLNPADPASRSTLVIAAALTVVAVVGKFAAGYAPFWFRGRKLVIGVGMIPRGEVGLIFAQMGLREKILSPGLFAALTLVVMLTTFLAPPLLKAAFPPKPEGYVPKDLEGIEDLVTE